MHIRLTVLASPLKPEVIGTFTNSVLDIAHIDFPYSPSVCPPYDDRRSLNGELPSMWGAECGWTHSAERAPSQLGHPIAQLRPH
jgi:hypothetical protein